MKRYYYIDPLAAAWMAKHFGIKYDSSPSSFFFSSDGVPTSFHPTKYNIHSDSLYLLDPQLGDIAIGVAEKSIGYLKDIEDRCCFLSGGYGYAKEDIKIIQRNGIAFHWPEVEQA